MAAFDVAPPADDVKLIRFPFGSCGLSKSKALARRPFGVRFTEPQRPPSRAQTSRLELGRRLGDEFALMAGALEFNLARMPLALSAGDRRRAVGRAAHDLLERHLACVAVGQADDHQAEMQQVGDDREQRRLVAAMLARARGEGPPTLP